MSTRDYYDTDFDQYPSLVYKNENPDKGLAVIDVPQAFFGCAQGPVKDLRFMRTTVAQCVALALVGWESPKPVYGRKPHKVKSNNHGKKFPSVVLGHIDDAAPEGAQGLISMCKREGMIGIHAYVVNGDLEPPLLGQVLECLHRGGIPFQLETGCHLGTLAIDLVDGKPMDPFALEESAEYKPEKTLENAYFQQIFNRIYPVACAFNLENGIPERHFRVGPEAPKNRLAPVLDETEFKNVTASISAKSTTVFVPGSERKKKNTNKEKPTRHIRWAKERQYNISQIPTFTMETFTLGFPKKPSP